MQLSPVFRALLTSVVCASAAVAAQYATGQWSLVQEGHSGVSALELAVVSETTVMIFDKVEHNPLQTNGHVAWASELDLISRTVRPLNPTSNTWCGAGSFLSNGTMISSGGNPIVIAGGNGLAAIRLFTPCEDKSCDVEENQSVRRMASLRWYHSSVRLEDGSLMLFGGSWDNAIINMPNITNPTYEFFPPKNIHGHNGTPIYVPFLDETLNANYFPLLIQLPDGNFFVAANKKAIIWDWKTNQEILRLPDIPNNITITNPIPASATLLPLTPENNYTPEVLICGGSAYPDDIPSWDRFAMSSQEPTSDQCIRIALTDEGIAQGWEVETMPQPRIMSEMVVLPDGRVLILNGAQTGISGYTWASEQIGESDADHPALTPVLYDPLAAPGERFTQEGLPTSEIARMYHSTASLTPNASVLIAGSNPNDDIQTNTTTHPFPTEYRLEWLSPPYMEHTRPSYTGLPDTFDYNAEIALDVTLPEGTQNVSAVLMDFGFATHGVHMDQRLVGLVSELSADGTQLTVTGPPTPQIFSPGPGYIFVLADGVPSFGHKTLIGTGAQPPFDQDAFDSVLSRQPVYWDDWTNFHPEASEEERQLFSTISAPAATSTSGSTTGY
ncbi:hypothetical protein K435DRAFT_711766 [Dendrothele bispora CBS 962.96]|uniref:Copper radical oxidase n=1 Tax=Dendrothele bispora (strain CBS 962.96) TaxID=1314807 RepID=A0A4S8MST1_DENBC|nr:hypothetical protein K435DRAFT_711766 [Dendrothele bispora CBS 962.96]